MGNIKWNYESCFEEAKKYKKRSVFQKESSGAYQVALKNGWLDDYTWLPKVKDLTRETCYEEAKKYKSRSEFYKKSCSAYNVALKNGWIDDYTWFKKVNNWTKESCYEEAKKYASRLEFQKVNCSAYTKAYRNGWLDDYTWFEINRKRRTFKELKEDILSNFPHYFDNITIVNEDELNKMNDSFKIISKKVILQCTKDGYIWETTGNRMLIGCGCPKCGGSLKKTHEEFIKELKEKKPYIFDSIEILGKYKTSATPIKVRCKKCGHTWETNGNTLLSGCGCQRCWYNSISKTGKAFLKQDKLQLLNEFDLENMSYHQLIELISSNVLPQEFSTLAYSESGSDARRNKISELRDDYGDETRDDEDIKKELEESIRKQDEEFTNASSSYDDDLEYLDNEETTSSSTTNEEEEKHDSLPSLTTKELISYDKAFVSYGEKNKYIAEEEVHRIWNAVLTDETYVETLSQMKGEKSDGWLESVKELFFKEYNEVKAIKPDENYKFKYAPSLMQKLMVYKLLTNDYYCNWCGTGAGKTNSFLMATRATNSHNVVCITPKSVIDDMSEFSIKDIYPDSNIIVYENLSSIKKIDEDKFNYILINYEKFQQTGTKEMIEKLVSTNRIDFICFDEIHRTKVRDENASTRSKNIKYFRMLAAEKNPKIKVLGMTATPLINNLTEVKNLLELVTGKKYDDIGHSSTINNIHIAYKQLILNGFRYVPNYKIGVTRSTPRCDGEALKDKLIRYNNSDVNKIEGIFVNDKMDLVRDELKPHTIIYTNFITGVVSKIKKKLKEFGFTSDEYTGRDDVNERVSIKEKFISGKTDILIASSPLSTGVDGLQKICNNIIIISLPWTNAEYTQLIGRINRQGSSFDNVNIVIPQVYIELSDGRKWSWDKKRLDIIEKKKTLSDAVVDGYFSELYNLNKSKLLRDAIESLRNGIKDFEQHREDVEIEEPDTVQTVREYKESVICNMHKRASISKHSTMHNYFTDNPEAWTEYHRIREENKKEWNEDPLDVIAGWINANPRDMIIADLGCGMNSLKDKIHYSKIYSVDHYSNDDSVIKCDMADLSEYIKDEELDCAVFCLSLWGTDYMDYIKEAYRMLKDGGIVYIAQPNDKVKQEILLTGSLNIGFKIQTLDHKGNFTYIILKKE